MGPCTPVDTGNAYDTASIGKYYSLTTYGILENNVSETLLGFGRGCQQSYGNTMTEVYFEACYVSPMFFRFFKRNIYHEDRSFFLEGQGVIGYFY